MSRPRFLYHAYALGVSGRVNDDLIEPQVASALPLAGGHSAANWSNYQLQSLFSYDAAETVTTGRLNESEDTHKTVSSAKIAGFNFDNTVLAQEVSVQLTSIHSASKDDQPRFSLTGTQFEGLVVAGQKIELESLVGRYSELSTYQAVCDYYSQNAKTLDAELLRQPETSLPDKIRSYFPWCGKEPKTPGLPSHRDVTIVPLFLVKNKSIPGRFEVINNVIRVAGFGVVQLGQLALSPYERRVTMIQVDLDPAKDDSGDNAVQSFGFGGGRASGGLSCGSVGSNGGQTDPPLGN